MQLRFAVEFGPGDATLGSYSAAARVNVDAFHWHQIYHYPAVHCRSTCYVVTAAPNCHFQVKVPGNVYSVDHVGDTTAAADQCRALVHKPIVHLSCLFIARITREQELPLE